MSGSFRIFAECFFEIGNAAVSKEFGDFRNIHVTVRQKLSGKLDAVDVDEFIDGIACEFFEDPA